MRRLILMLISGASVGLTGCRPNAPPGDPGPPPTGWSDDMQAVADGNNRFALDLYAKLREGKGNVFFSPYSVHTALAMTATGAKAATRDQMVKVLHLPADGQKAGVPGDLGRFYAQPRADYQLSVANALWGQTGFPWRPAFLDLQRTRFGAGFKEADFLADPEAERTRINGWAQEQTRDRIKDLLRKGLITKQHRLVLANAVYFKGAWKDPFDPKLTLPRDFTQTDGTKSQVPTMRREGKFQMYVEARPDRRFEPELQVAELPYKGGELSMVVLLPGKHDGLPPLEAKLTLDALAGWLTKAKEVTDADIFLPKFRIEADAMTLNEPLQKLGLVAAFDPAAADFTGLHTGGEQLFLDVVVQKAFVDVNEEGTEAAAATAVGAREESARLGFQATHPFLFLIRDTRHGTILFMGRVEKP
jgi:serpin B